MGLGDVFSNFKKGAISVASKINNKKFVGINSCNICQAAANVLGNLQGLIDLLSFGAGNCGGTSGTNSGGNATSYGTVQTGKAYKGATYYSESDKQKKGAAKKLGIKVPVYSSGNEKKKAEIKEAIDELKAVEKDIEEWVEEDIEGVTKKKVKLLKEVADKVNELNRKKKKKNKKGDLKKKTIDEITNELLDNGLISEDDKDKIDNSGLTGSDIDQSLNGYIDSNIAKKIQRSNLFDELDESTKKTLANITQSDSNLSHSKSIFSNDNSIRKNNYALDNSGAIGNSTTSSKSSSTSNTASLNSIFNDLKKNRGYDFIERQFVVDNELNRFPNIEGHEDYYRKLDEINDKHYELKDMISELEDIKNIANLMDDVRSDGKNLSDLINGFRNYYNQINYYNYYETGNYQNPNNRDGNYSFGNQQNFYISNHNATYIQNIIYNGTNGGVPTINWKGTGEDSSYLSNDRIKSSTSGDTNDQYGNGNDGKSNNYGDRKEYLDSISNNSFDTGGAYAYDFSVDDGYGNNYSSRDGTIYASDNNSSKSRNRRKRIISSNYSPSNGYGDNNPNGGSSATGNSGYTGDGGTGNNTRSWSSDGNGYQNGNKVINNISINNYYNIYNQYGDNSEKDDGSYSTKDSVRDKESYSDNSGNSDSDSNYYGGDGSSQYIKNDFSGNDNYNGSVSDIGKTVYDNSDNYSNGDNSNWWDSNNYNSRDIESEREVEKEKITIDNNLETPTKDDIDEILDNSNLLSSDSSDSTINTTINTTINRYYVNKTLNVNKSESKLYNSNLATQKGVNSKGIDISDEGLRPNNNDNSGWEQAENKLTAVINTVIRTSESQGGGGIYTEADLSEIIEEAEVGWDIFNRYDPIVKKKLFCPEAGFVVDHYIVRDPRFASPIITESKLKNLRKVYNTLLRPIYIHFFDRAKTDACVLNIITGLCSQAYAVACLSGHALSRHIFGQAVDFSIAGLTTREIFDEIKNGTLLLDYGVLNLNEDHIHITLPYNFKGRNIYHLNIAPDITANSDSDLNFTW